MPFTTRLPAPTFADLFEMRPIEMILSAKSRSFGGMISAPRVAKSFRNGMPVIDDRAQKAMPAVQRGCETPCQADAGSAAAVSKTRPDIVFPVGECGGIDGQYQRFEPGSRDAVTSASIRSGSPGEIGLKPRAGSSIGHVLLADQRGPLMIIGMRLSAATVPA